MAAALIEDEENPPLQRKAFFGLFKDPDPGFSQTAISCVANVVMANMLVYGVSGNGKMAFWASLFTIPASAILCVRDSQKDYDKWKDMAALRDKGVPERFMPYKCKYDWSDYHRQQIMKRLE